MNPYIKASSEELSQKYEQIPINIPIMRTWELTDNSTLYEAMRAAPGDNELFYMWVFWLLNQLIVSIVVAVTFFGVLLSRSTRKKVFNIYLLFLMCPDLFMSAMCVLTCVLNLYADQYYSVEMCNFQSWYLIFGIAANSWINAAIAYELHRMLRLSHNRRRYFPPSKRAVVKQCIIAYAWAALLATIGILRRTPLPHRTGLINGAACIPLEYDAASKIFFLVLFLPCFAGVPLVYVTWVFVDVHRKHYLPKTGKTRMLAVYFFRLVVVFIIMWVPSLVFIFFTGGMFDPWVLWAGGLWSHAQGLVSAAVSLLKDDVALAVKNLLCLRWGDYGCGKGISPEETEMEYSQHQRSSLRNFAASLPRISKRSRNSSSSNDPQANNSTASHHYSSEEVVLSEQFDVEGDNEKAAPESAPLAKGASPESAPTCDDKV